MTTPCHTKKKKDCAQDHHCQWKSGKGCKDIDPARYFQKESKIIKNDKKAKFCRCVLHVMNSNFSNPYAICASKLKTTTGGKSCEYDWSQIPFSEVKAYSLYHAQKMNLTPKEIHSMSKEKLKEVLTKWYLQKTSSNSKKNKASQKSSQTADANPKHPKHKNGQHFIINAFKANQSVRK